MHVKEIGTKLENMELLDLSNEIHIGAFHRTILPPLNRIYNKIKLLDYF